MTVAIVLGASVLHGGEPNVWDAAREPRRVQDLVVLRAAEIAHYQAVSQNFFALRIPVFSALRELERMDAGTSPEPRVRFFYGRMLTYFEADEHAARVLRDAIDFAPNHPDVCEALFSLGVSLARLGQIDDELALFPQWNALEWSTASRATGLSNFAEGFMSAGRLEEAIELYREAIAADYENTLAHWGLAVALDRTGDTPTAIAEINIALLFDPRAEDIDRPSVFFVPPFDRYWYNALGSMARAEAAENPQSKLAHWETAVSHWKRYLENAPASEKYVPIARHRLAYCTQQSATARSRATQSRGQRALPGRSTR